MINKDGGRTILDFMGGHSCCEGEDRAHGGPPSPPTRENPVRPGQSKDKGAFFISNLTSKDDA